MLRILVVTHIQDSDLRPPHGEQIGQHLPQPATPARDDDHFLAEIDFAGPAVGHGFEEGPEVPDGRKGDEDGGGDEVRPGGLGGQEAEEEGEEEGWGEEAEEDGVEEVDAP